MKERKRKEIEWRRKSQWSLAGRKRERYLRDCQAERQVFFLRKKKSEMATDVADLPPG